MDEAKKLLDSLMGQTRNVPMKEAKKNKGNNFKADDVCKFYLLGFCPQHEDLFKNTKRHLGECEKIHSDALKEELEAHPDKAEFKAKYCTALIRYLESVVRMADDAIARQKLGIEAQNKDLAENGPNEVARQEVAKLRENCDWYLAEAEKCAEKGSMKESQQWHEEHQRQKIKADEYEEKCKQPVALEVCDICGIRPEEFDTLRKFAHIEGKVHTGFKKVRDWLTKTKEMQTELESEVAESRKNGKDKRDDDVRDGGEKMKRDDAGGEKVDRGDRERSRGKEGGRGERSQDDRRGRGERGERERSRGRDGGRDGDRGYRGGGDRGYDRRGGDSRGQNRGDRGYDNGDVHSRDRRQRSRSREPRRY